MKMTPDEVCEIIRAHAEGKKLEFRDPNDNHFEDSACTIPIIINNIYRSDFIYRVKPEPEIYYKMIVGADGHQVDGIYMYTEKEMKHSLNREPLRKFKKFIEVID